MLSKSMEEALNEQLNFEFFSSQLYLSISAYFNSIDLAGFSHWMKIQYEEEVFHALKFFDFIDQKNGRVLLSGHPAPTIQWNSPLEAFEQSLSHEVEVTRRINELVSKALAENDHATNNFLQWFVGEQVEEEATVNGIVQKLKLAKDSSSTLFLIDQELSKRTFTPPSSQA